MDPLLCRDLGASVTDMMRTWEIPPELTAQVLGLDAEQWADFTTSHTLPELVSVVMAATSLIRLRRLVEGTRPTGNGRKGYEWLRTPLVADPGAPAGSIDTPLDVWGSQGTNRLIELCERLQRWKPTSP